MFNNQINPYFLNNTNVPFPYRRPLQINWKNLLNNTQKTLNVINQAAPLVYQLKPIYNNVKTMLKVHSILRTPENIKEKKDEKKDTSSNEPIFFL